MNGNLTKLARIADALRSLATEVDELRGHESIVRIETIERAERMIVTLLASRPRTTTTAIRKRARSFRLSNESVARAIESLQARDSIRFENGLRGSKRWSLAAAGGNGSHSAPGAARLAESDAAVHSDSSDPSTPQNGNEADASVDDVTDGHGAIANVE